MELRRYWAKDYAGQPFKLFGTSHLVVLVIVLGVNLAWVWLRPSLDVNARLAIRLALAAGLLLNESVWHLWNLTTGQWTVKELLPFHLCSLMVYLTPVMLLTRNPLVYQFSYFMGLGGGLQALLTPDAGRYGFPHVKFWCTTVSHSLLVTAPLYMTLVEGYRPTVSGALTVAVGMVLYTGLIMLLNARLGSNYLFVARPPDTPSLIDRLGPWPWYVGWLILIGAGMIALLYLPFLFF